MTEIGNLTADEMNEYQQSLKIERDNYAAMLTLKNEERAKAEEEKRETAIKLAFEMLTDNVPIDKISKYTKLSIEEIEALRF